MALESSEPSTLSESQELFPFMVYAPDQTDPEALSRRLAVRPQHLVDLQVRVAVGMISEFDISNFLSQ